MTVIEGICAKCGKPFIWVVVADMNTASYLFVECPHCKSSEVGLWHPRQWAPIVKGGRSIHNEPKEVKIANLPLVIEDEMVANLSPDIIDNMVIGHKRKWGKLPVYFGVSRKIFQQYKFDITDSCTEGSYFLRGEFKIPVKVLD